MPGRDGTGPLGFGPMSGWGRGFCIGYGGRPYGGRGLGRGLGWGQGCFSPGPARMTQEIETDILKNRAQYLENELQAVNSRLTKLGQEGSPE